MKCPKCSANRFSSKNIPAKHFLYLPLGPRFARMYGTASLAQVVHSLVESDETKAMTAFQHSPIRKSSCDSISAVFLQSSLDGMNPFNKNKTWYSMWPITIAMLNLPKQIMYLFGRMFLVCIVPSKSMMHTRRLPFHLSVKSFPTSLTILVLARCSMFLVRVHTEDVLGVKSKISTCKLHLLLLILLYYL